MKKLTARVVHLEEGGEDSEAEIEDTETVVSARFEYPHVWLVVVNETAVVI